MDGNGAAKEPNALSITTTLQESKEHLSTLKSHIAFAHQCLSLLQNQLNHAADTLSILQDEVVKAQETMEHVVLPGTVVDQAPHALGFNANMASHYHSHSQCSAASAVSGQAAVLAQNGKGQNLCSGGGGEQGLTEGGVAHAACTAAFSQSQCTVCTEAHAGGTQQHHVDTPLHDKSHESTGAAGQDSAEGDMTSYPTPVSNCETRPGGLMQGELSVKIEPNTSPLRETGRQNVSQIQHCDGCTIDSADPPKVESSSPMAHQLLQVIDVLQSAADDKDDGQAAGVSLISSNPQSAPQGSPSVSHLESFASSIPMDSRLLHTMSPGSSSHSRQRASPRRNRKQDLLLKHQASSEVPGNADLMRVPQPVLASTLPPEFLVVPATNYDQDVSPGTVSAAKQAKESGASSSGDGAVAIMPFMTAATDVMTVDSSSADSDGSRCSVVDVEQNNEVGVVTCLTQSTLQVSADPSYSGHSIVHINRCTRDVDNVLTRSSSVYTSAGSEVALPNLSSGGLSNTMPSSLNSPHNGLQFVPTSVRQSDCTETGATASSVVYAQFRQHPEAEPAMSQHTALERQALEVSSLGSSPAKTRAGSTGTKKPIILSRRSSREQSLPEGVVVLVPTIEDAKRLIASTGGNSSGRTPVLIPQQMLNDIHGTDKGRLHEDEVVSLPTKRRFHSVSSLPANDTSTKRLATMTESL